MKITTSRGPDNVWIAIDEDTYEAESDSLGVWSGSPQGYDDTEIGAIRDLLDLIEDRASSIKADDGQPTEQQEWSDYDRDC